MCIANSMMNS
uniref:Uncharacterized protein n=1 Tax=Arundo donax TaxID=35708 RepID=A0A0A9AX42_ARUDO